jgi:WD40 repeat protein
MRKNIIMAGLAGAFFIYGMRAMGQEMLQLKAKAQKSDAEANTEFALAKDHALLSGTIHDAYDDLSVDGKLTGSIPLSNVTQSQVEALLNGDNYDYLLSVHRAYNQANPQAIIGISTEKREKRAKMEAGRLGATEFSLEAFMQALDYLKAAHYLNIPELIEKYASTIASMFCSNASMQLLQAHDQAYTKMIHEINEQRTFADRIKEYIPADVWALEHTLTGHNGYVLSAEFSPNGSKIVTGSLDKTAKIWNAQTGALEYTLWGHTESVFSAEFSPDGSKIVTASNGKTAKIWNAQTGVLERTLIGHTGDLCSAEFSPDGSKIVTASVDGTAKIWNAVTGALERDLVGHTGSVLSAEFSPDGSKIVTASVDGTAKIWNAVTGALERDLVGHTSSVLSAEFSPDGSKIVTASVDGTAKIWNAVTGALERHLVGHTSSVRSASFSPDGSKIVTVDYDARVRIWDAVTGALEHTLEDTSRVASFSPDGSKIVTASEDGTAKIWNAQTGALEYTLVGHTGDVRSASFSPDGTKIVTASDDGTAKIWALLPARTMEQALFLQFMEFNKNKGGSAGWESGWGRTVMDTFEPDEKKRIKSEFPKTLQQKIGSWFGVGSSSSSSNNNN